MTNELSNHEDRQEPPSDGDLVAYLDGELSAELSREIEKQLAHDSELRRRLQQHQVAWDLLDDVPRPDVGESFTRTTIEMVAVTAADDVQTSERQIRRRRQLAWAVAVSAWVLIAGGSFAVVHLVYSSPNRQLVEDLPILENLDAYRNVDDVEFLRSLARENLFVGELDDAL